MVVLGIDPGIARMGYGVLERPKSRDQIKILDYGCLETPSQMSSTERVLQLAEELEKLIATHSPTVIALETLFFNVNVKTAMSVGRASGVVLLLAGKHSLELVEYTPQEIKTAVTGYGKADKGQIQRMVQTLLGLPEVPKPDDTADALAVALCHAVS